MKKFYSIEYTDHEGDLIIKHALLEPEEASEVLRKMIENGIQGCVCDLSPQTDPLPVLPVMSTNEEV